MQYIHEVSLCSMLMIAISRTHKESVPAINSQVDGKVVEAEAFGIEGGEFSLYKGYKCYSEFGATLSGLSMP